MNIFGRRRKESSQPSGSTAKGSSSGVNPISILSATLPKSYRQNNTSTASPKKGQKIGSDAALPPTPPLSPDKENNHFNVKPRAHHATAPASAAAHHQQYHVGSHDSNGHYTGGVFINELGQMEHSNHSQQQQLPPSHQNGQPAFMVNGTGVGQQHHHSSSTRTDHGLPPIPRDPSSSRDLNLKAFPNLKIANRRMSTGSIPSIDAMMANNKAATDAAELQLCYGYWPIETQVELNLAQIEEIVRLAGYEIRTRGIEAPLLFSTQALDISMEGICSLIRPYLSSKDIWRSRDLKFATPHDLCGMIKWALGRYVNNQGGRGFITWEMYEKWRFGEREKVSADFVVCPANGKTLALGRLAEVQHFSMQDFTPRYITTHMIYLLPTQNAALLTTLFSLMTSALAYTTKNGCTVRKLATLFSSYIFGLPDDGTFEHTYTAFNRFSHATEHLLLAYIRDQVYQHEASGAVTTLPRRICDLVKDYVQNLPTNLNKPPQGADLQVIVRIRRNVRWYSKNLIASAGTWEVPRSKAWASIAPLPQSKVDDDNKPSPFAYSSKYKHLLNIQSIADDEDEEDMQKYSSMVEKEWKSFMQSGFAPPDAAKLRFDLTESERANRRRKHETIDWTTFENSGFQGRETFLDDDLNFNPGANDPVNKEDLLSEARAKLIAERGRNVEKSLPVFNYDITPQEERSIQVDKQFLEVYSDVLCSSGWAREEVKESSWALIQFRTRPLNTNRPVSAGSDGRSDDTWFLVEEVVPADYRASLLEKAQAKPKASRRISFLRPVRKKASKQHQQLPALPDITKSFGFFNRSSETINRNSKAGLAQFRQQSTAVQRSGTPNLKTPDDSIFASGPTQVIKLSNSILSPGVSKASSLHDHEEELEDIEGAPVLVEKEDAKSFQQDRAGLGYARAQTSSATGSGFLDMVRKTTRRHTRRSLLGQSDMSATSDYDSVPNSPASTVVPGSPGFSLAEHGVQGPGQPMDNPNDWMDRMARMSNTRPDLGPQRYERSPASFAGTTHSIDTRVTQGHSDSSVHSDSSKPTHAEPLERQQLKNDSEGHDSASLYDRDLPAPPSDPQASPQPFSSATQDAEDLVQAYTRDRDSTTSEPNSTEDPYDGIAHDEETLDSHHAAKQSFDALDVSSSTSKDLPKLYIVPGRSSPAGTHGDNAPAQRKPLRNVSQASHGDQRISKPLPSPHDVEELLKSPIVPVNGTGKVGSLAGRFGSTVSKNPRPIK
ncbi:hypothetical protein P389DRAFT_207285 [Cystobasidium minutum MCA 4210]|uniref:uncharacterized protein n=1 Tax=Cystobasidium minutum MCA 4210 TaxID=1397322 RepID=UPI0034CF69D3|eukprot:jgi/Rhomi1/207285/estExt_Genemark1.C_1_t10168